MFIFARFHAKVVLQDAVAAAIKEVLIPTRQEPMRIRIEVRYSRD
jgi:hypothetical protein